MMRSNLNLRKATQLIGQNGVKTKDQFVNQSETL